MSFVYSVVSLRRRELQSLENTHAWKREFEWREEIEAYGHAMNPWFSLHVLTACPPRQKDSCSSNDIFSLWNYWPSGLYKSVSSPIYLKTDLMLMWGTIIKIVYFLKLIFSSLNGLRNGFSDLLVPNCTSNGWAIYKSWKLKYTSLVLNLHRACLTAN